MANTMTTLPKPGNSALSGAFPTKSRLLSAVFRVAPTERARNSQGKLPFGMLTYLGIGASLAVCYGKTFVCLLFDLGSVDWPFPVMNPHFQALLMWVLGFVSVFGLARDSRMHRNVTPLALGFVGITTIVVTLYTVYSPSIEAIGYTLLLAAAFLNQNTMLRKLHNEVASLNDDLENRVEQQVSEIDRLHRLERFLAPQVAKMITAEQEQSLLRSHRAYIATLFCDLRGFTDFSSRREPEEVMRVLQHYHRKLGKVVAQHGGTIDHRAGDGLMVFFNDPLPCDQPTMTAIQCAIDMRKAISTLNADWKKRGYQLGFGVGIASGYATIGAVGYKGRYDYTANGNAVNLASRLCSEAQHSQILICHQTLLDVGEVIDASPAGERRLKGFEKRVAIYNVKRLAATHVEANSDIAA